MSVDVSVKFRDGPSEEMGLLGVQGGIRIVVDGKEITKYKKQQKIDTSGYFENQDIRYKGWHIVPLMENLTRSLVVFNTGSYDGTDERQESMRDPNREEHRLELYEWYSEIVVSRVNGVNLRVAFQCIWDIDKKPDAIFHTPVECGRGYAVDRQEFSEEVLECAHEVLEYIQKCGIDKSRVANLRKNTNRLEEIIE